LKIEKTPDFKLQQLLTVLSVHVSGADWKKEEKMTNAYHSIFYLL
jgi:hypothetical protein